jgi:hypothetical protein
MKRLFIFLLLSCLNQAAQADDSSFAQGNYECSGKELGKEETFKIISSIEKTGQTYSIKSHYKGSAYFGTGIYDAANKSLSAVVINPEEPKETCIIIFHVKDKNRLEASWTYIGQKAVGQAVCSLK